MTNIGNVFKEQFFGAKIDGLVKEIKTTDLLLSGTEGYVYFDLAAEGFTLFSIFAVILNTTITLEGSNNSVDTADASASWFDVTKVLTGDDNKIASGAWILTAPANIKRMRIKWATTNDSNSLKLFLTRAKGN